jgi:hypothetical protein
MPILDEVLTIFQVDVLILMTYEVHEAQMLLPQHLMEAHLE